MEKHELAGKTHFALQEGVFGEAQKKVSLTHTERNRSTYSFSSICVALVQKKHQCYAQVCVKQICVGVSERHVP